MAVWHYYEVGHLHVCTRRLAIFSLKERMEMSVSMLSVFWIVFQLSAAACWKEERPRADFALGTFNRICVTVRVSCFGGGRGWSR